MLRVLSPKRRLPVLQSGDDPDAPPRPRWQWVAFGTLAILSAWLPLAYAAEALSARIVAGAHDTAGLTTEQGAKMSFALWALPTAALALAAIGGGYVLGRWGEGAGALQAAEAGVIVALFPVLLVWVSSGVSWAPLGAVAVAAPAAALGGLVGGRRRSPRLT